MSSGSSGLIAAALAFIEAGNYRLAEQHITTVFATDPIDSEACEAWCKLLTRQKKFAELEAFPEAWIGRDGRNYLAYFNLAGSYIVRKDRKKATVALAQFRERFPILIQVHSALQSMLEANCAKDASDYDSMIALYKSANDHKNVLRLQSQAAYHRSDFSMAVHLGDQSWGDGYTETSFASYMAMLCFRSFRFGKSRHYARLALRAEPGHAVAKELLILSRLVWFPHFLITHALLFALAQVNCRREFVAPVGILGILVAYLLVFTRIGWPSDPLASWIAWSTMMFTVLYCLYTPFIGTIAAFVHRHAPPTIRLTKY